MSYLLTDSHLHTVDNVLAEHTTRTTHPPKVFEADGVTETIPSMAARFKSYDDYETYTISLSRLAVEATISVSLREKIETRFAHYQDFSILPGSVYLMMIFDTCNSSASLDIETARASLYNDSSYW